MTTILTKQIKDMQQTMSTPRRITRSTLARSNEDGIFIESLPDVDLSEKCNDFIAMKLIMIQEAKLSEAKILHISKKFLADFSNNFTPTVKDEKTKEAEIHSKPFPALKLKNKELGEKGQN